MDDKERALLRVLYELQRELLHHQAEQIAALQRAHEVLGKLLKQTAEQLARRS